MKRKFEEIPIEVSPRQSSTDLTNLINSTLEKYTSASGFNPKTAAKIKLNFVGELTYETVWQINNILGKKRRDIFTDLKKYNIMQLIWVTSDISEDLEHPSSAGIIEDYILENPDEEFKTFVKEKLRDDETDLDLEKLTHFGMEAIKKALVIHKEE